MKNYDELVEINHNQNWFYVGSSIKDTCTFRRGVGGESAKSRQLLTGGMGVDQMWMSILNKNDFNFFIIWKYFLQNIKVIFEYSVTGKIWPHCKVYLFPLNTNTHTHTHTHTFYMYYHLAREACLISFNKQFIFNQKKCPPPIF